MRIRRPGYGVSIGSRQGEEEYNEEGERKVETKASANTEGNRERKECMGACKESDENEDGSR